MVKGIRRNNMANTKKSNTKKQTPKKEPIKKESVKRKNTTTKKIDKTKKEKQPKDLTTKILLVIFLVLCVVVFVLATIMITENANSKKDKYDIQVPITEQELSSGIDIRINMDDVEKNQSKEYRIQTTNYIDEDKVNDKIMTYKMRINVPDDSDIDVELYSSTENFELLQGKTEITDQRLGKDTKEEITYTLKLTQRQKPSEDDYVNIKITKDE